MADLAKNITSLYPDQQLSPKNEPEKPWLRMKNEPAVWFMCFKIYLDLGRSRTLRKALAMDRGLDLAAIGDEGLRKIKLPGSWQRASKTWNWKARAEAYDLSEVESRSAILHTIVGQLRFCSPAYRICELHSIALDLSEHLHRGSVPTKTYLALSARLQSVLKDIASELATLNIDTKYADSLGLEDLILSKRIKI